MSLDLAKSFLDSKMADRSQYCDDYQSQFPQGEPLPADAVWSIMRSVLAASSDFSFNASNWQQHGDDVTVDIKVTGSMTADFSHPMLGDIPNTGKKAVLPIEHLTLSFRDGKVAGMVVKCDEPCGPPELLRQWTS